MTEPGADRKMEKLFLESLTYLVQEADRKNPTQYGLQLRVKLDSALNATPKSEAVNVEK